MAIKWQQILTYGSSGIVGLAFLLAGILNLSGMSYSFDGNKTCTDCYSEIRVNSTYWEIKVENAGNNPIVFRKTLSPVLYINLDKIDELITTNPPIKTEILVPTTSKFATQKNEEYGYLRLLKSGDALIHRYSRSNPSESRFIIHGANVSTIVKWSFDLDSVYSREISIDPIWFGINIELIKGCYNLSYFVNDYSVIFKNISYIYINNATFVNETRIRTINETIVSGKHEEFNEICRNIGIQIDNKKILWERDEWACKRDLFKITCDSQIQGNGDGICQSGEGCIEADVRNLRDLKISNFVKTSYTRVIEVENV